MNLIKKFLLALSVSLISFNSLFAQGTLSFDPRDCGLNCTANDVNITGAQLYSDQAGTTPLSGSCVAGTVINAYIGITFVNNSNANRGVIALASDIYINGAFYQELKYCPSLILAGNQTKVFTIPIAVRWTCGQSIELRDILGGWATGGSLTTCPSGCSGITASKCSDTIPNIVVITPPTAIFSAACSATKKNTVEFTNTSTGGASNTLTYSWNFGDGSPLATDVNPIHTYAAPGPYTVTLTVTNSVGSDGEVLTVNPENCLGQPIGQPVRLLSFEASKTEKPEKVTLNWTTDNAQDFSHFEVEKSQNAQFFYTIGTVLAENLGKEKTSFKYFDNLSKGISYYRLKMLDLDGSYSYSKILVINNSNTEIQISNPYPNPAKEAAFVKITTNEAGMIYIKVFGPNGAMLQEKTLYLEVGTNQIRIDRLERGNNFVTIANKTMVRTLKIVKIK